MTYTILAALGIVLALVLDRFILRTNLVTTARFWFSYAILLFFQLLTNGWLTGRGIVRYDEAVITGLRIAYAPLEDLGFGFALILFTLTIWRWLSRSQRFSAPA